MAFASPSRTGLYGIAGIGLYRLRLDRFVSTIEDPTPRPSACGSNRGSDFSSGSGCCRAGRMWPGPGGTPGPEKGATVEPSIWHTATLWLDVAAFLLLLLVGHILLGHFEDYKPKWRRILKVVLSLALFIAAVAALGRVWAWVIFAVPVAIGIPIVHMWWLPKQGINGWTGEPREKYLELVRSRKRPWSR